VAVRTPSSNALFLEEAGFRVRKLLLIPHYNVLRFLHCLTIIPVLGKFLHARIFIEAVAA
jgi:hypothetical protein